MRCVVLHWIGTAAFHICVEENTLPGIGLELIMPSFGGCKSKFVRLSVCIYNIYNMYSFLYKRIVYIYYIHSIYCFLYTKVEENLVLDIKCVKQTCHDFSVLQGREMSLI